MSHDDLTSITWSGEMLDIVLSSFNNSYGKERIWHSMQYGIYLPISKYEDELVEITGATIDDKSDKRKYRLLFLKTCQDYPILDDFFRLLLCWLNGGGDKKAGVYTPGDYSFSQYEIQNLILTVSGGNIVTIFARLLHNIAAAWAATQPSTSDEEFFNNITTTNRQILNELENKKTNNKFALLAHIKNLLFTVDGTPGPLLLAINSLLKVASDFSDFDYGLVPNKDPFTKDMDPEKESGYVHTIFEDIRRRGGGGTGGGTSRIYII